MTDGPSIPTLIFLNQQTLNCEFLWGTNEAALEECFVVSKIDLFN